VKVLLTTLNAKFIHSSLALYSLRRNCLEVCPDIVVREYTINNELLAVLGDIYRAKPDVVGLACYIWNIDAILDLAAMLKKILPDTAIILGGPEVTYDPEEIMTANPAVDYIVLGEGEETLASLLAALRDNRPPVGIPGLAWRRAGTIAVGAPQVVRNLAALPFAYDETDMAALKDKIIYYETSRGCPYSCTYCLSGAAGGVRFLPVDRVLAELAFFIAHGVRQIKFVDRTFNASRDHCLPILAFLAAHDTTANFHCEIAADLLDDEILALLAGVPPGRFQFEIGVQSTNPATLDAICRKNDWPRIAAGVGALRQAGKSHLHLDLIVGLPHEDYPAFGRSFNAVYVLRPHMLQIGFLKLLKVSAIRAQAAEHGYIFMDRAPYEVLANNYLSYAEIRRLKILEEMFNQLYNGGRFTATLEWLTAAWDGDAFALYEQIAAYWEKHDLHLNAHSGKTIVRHLDAFCREARPALADDCQQFLKFDALSRDSDVGRPEFLPWNGGEWDEAKNAFWRDETVVTRYLPAYAFTSWREVKKNYHLEIFPFDIPAWLISGELRRQATTVLFSRRAGDPPWQTVAAADFPKGREL